MNLKLVATDTVARRAGSLPIGDWLFRGVVYGSGLALLAVMVAMVYELADGARPSFAKFGFGFLTGTTWDPVKEVFGALPLVYGTIVSSIVGLVIAVPISIGTAIFLSDLAPAWLRRPASYLIEIIAAIPSVILGLWGLFVLVPIVRDPIQKLLGDNLGFIPLFEGPRFGLGVLSAGIILAIMVVPIITAVSRDIFLAVPNSQREAMIALGATRWEVISQAVIPYARSGLIGAGILGFGRAIGETMAVTMVIGNGFKISPSLFEPSHTIASAIASEFSEATYDLYIAALVEAGLVLMAISLIINILARVLVGTLVRVPATVRE
ncbi:MAG: phosphate ABC transporter permease subunit PstC [Dehalococcoidia bacterium]|nr:phosphate ABC transporter permease subunit PstC [Dehalococcoidia bacterium]